jgi:hypothetical protein
MSALLTDEGTTTTITTTRPTAPARGGLFRRAWHRLVAAVQEMNYGARRIAEVQAPWTVDGHGRSR